MLPMQRSELVNLVKRLDLLATMAETLDEEIMELRSSLFDMADLPDKEMEEIQDRARIIEAS